MRSINSRFAYLHTYLLNYGVVILFGYMRSERGLNTILHCLQWYKLVLRTRLSTAAVQYLVHGVASGGGGAHEVQTERKYYEIHAVISDKAKGLKSLKDCIALYGKPITELRSVTCHMESHSVRLISKSTPANAPPAIRPCHSPIPVTSNSATFLFEAW